MRIAQDDIEGACINPHIGTLLHRSGKTHDDKPEVVGQIMTDNVKTVNLDQSIVDLVPLISEHGLRHIPVLDEDRKLAGMLTQADMINALYGHKLISG